MPNNTSGHPLRLSKMLKPAVCPGYSTSIWNSNLVLICILWKSSAQPHQVISAWNHKSISWNHYLWNKKLYHVRPEAHAWILLEVEVLQRVCMWSHFGEKKAEKLLWSFQGCSVIWRSEKWFLQEVSGEIDLIEGKGFICLFSNGK